MPGDDGVSSLRESMKQDYQHIERACKKKKKTQQPLFRDNYLSKSNGWGLFTFFFCRDLCRE